MTSMKCSLGCGKGVQLHLKDFWFYSGLYHLPRLENGFPFPIAFVVTLKVAPELPAFLFAQLLARH